MEHLLQAEQRNGNYYQRAKSLKNRPNLYCATCANKNKSQLTLHHVLPRFIGQHINLNKFLKCMTVVLCRDCHDEYEYSAEVFKKSFAKELSVNLKADKWIMDMDKTKVRYYANTILCNVNNLSDKIIHERREAILSYLSQDTYTYSDLVKIGSINPNMINPEYKDLGKEMLNKYGFENVRKIWYSHFLKFEKSKKAQYAIAA